jgi:hypothetical protein
MMGFRQDWHLVVGEVEPRNLLLISAAGWPSNHPLLRPWRKRTSASGAVVLSRSAHTEISPCPRVPFAGTVFPKA